MRVLCCILLAAALLFSCCSAVADEGWADANLPHERQPETIEIVPWDQIPPAQNGQHHYLLLCIDQWHSIPRPEGIDPPTGAGGMRRDLYGNTDGIVILTLDTRAKRIMLTSIIRDAIIRKPNSTETSAKYGRINYVYNDYGPEALCRTISEHLGIPIEKYILFNFGQIQDIIDLPSLGGVDIELNSNEIRYLAKYAVPVGSVVNADGVDVHQNPRAPEGTYHFRGHSAVLYMRIRKADSQGDFMRTQRVRNVLSALADKCRSFTLDQANELANSIMENNDATNMTLKEMLDAASFAYDLKSCTIEELRIPASEDVRAILFANMLAQEVNWPSARLKLADFLEHTKLTRDIDFLVSDDEDD